MWPNERLQLARATEGYSVKLVTSRRVLIESPTGEHYQVDPVAGKCDCSAG